MRGRYRYNVKPYESGRRDRHEHYYRYEKKITLDGQAGAGVNYQVRLSIGKSAGGDFTLSGHCQDDFSDIRFVDATRARKLNYWIESVSGGVATVWVKVEDDLSSGTVDIYIYYGYTGARTDASSGINTFVFFDDFSATSWAADLLSPEGAGWESGEDLRGGSVAYANGLYYLFYSNGTKATSDVGRATSPDLINWTKYASNPIIDNVCGPYVLTELDGQSPIVYDGKYWMANLVNGGAKIQVRSSSTIDGDTWAVERDEAITPSGNGDWFDDQVFACSFTRHAGTYYIFFQGYEDGGAEWASGYATASTPDGEWTVNTTALLTPSEAWEDTACIDPIIRQFDGTFYLFYTGHATSANQINSYATASAITGPYTKSEVLISAEGKSYPQIWKRGDRYYLLTDNLTSDGKRMYTALAPTDAFQPYSGNWEKNNVANPSGGELLIDAHQEWIKSDAWFLFDYAIAANVKFPDPLINYHYFGFQDSAAGASNNQCTITGFDDPFIKSVSGDADGSESNDIRTAEEGSYHTFRIGWNSGSAKYYIDGTLKATHTTEVCDVKNPAGFFELTGTGDLYLDWVGITKYVATEPGFNAAAAEVQKIR